MLELEKLTSVLSGIAVRETKDGPARYMRLSDLSELKAGGRPTLVRGEAPDVARALKIEEGDLIIGARGAATDVCIASDVVCGAFISLDLYLVRPNRTVVNPQYLAAVLELPSTQALLSVGKQGSGLARLPKDVLEKIAIPLPPMEGQRLIAGLALSFEEEGKLLRKLTDLNSMLGRESIARAINAVDTRPNSLRSSQ
jgi:hypothetical protein